MLRIRSFGRLAGKADITVGLNFMVERGVYLPAVAGPALAEVKGSVRVPEWASASDTGVKVRATPRLFN